MNKHNLGEGHFEKALVVSTQHISQKTSEEYLKRKSEERYPLVFDYEYGYLMFVPCGSTLDESWVNEPEDIVRLLRLAEENDCKLLRIDCDALPVDGLTKYEWE